MAESKRKPKDTHADAKSKGARNSESEAAPGDADWRIKTLDRMRGLILQADPEMIEERKWRKASNNMAGVPVWSHPRSEKKEGAAMVCTGEMYAKVVKLTFARGASLPDPAGLFNSSLDGNTRRAIDIHQGEVVNAAAFKNLIRAAIAESL